MQSIEEQHVAVAHIMRIVAVCGKNQHKLVFLLRGLQKELRRESVNGLTQTRIDNFSIKSRQFS